MGARSAWWLVVGVGLLAGSAWAAPRKKAPAPPPEPVWEGPLVDQGLEAAKARAGLVVFDLSAEGACTEEPAGPAAWKAGALFDALQATRGVVRPVSRADGGGEAASLVGGGKPFRVMRIAYKDGAEVDRLCRCAPEGRMADWVRGLAEGRTAAELARAALGPFEEGELDVAGELDVVEAHWCADRLDAAYDHLLALWDAIPERAPDQRATRLTRLPHDMAVLGSSSPAIAERIRALRDGLTEAKDTALPALDEWVALNRVLGDDALTIAWHAEARQDPARKEVADYVASNVFELLVERGQWAEAGALVDDPEAWLAAWKRSPGGLGAAIRGYGALAAAGRHGDAKKFAKDVVSVAPEGANCQLIEAAIAASAVHNSQKGLLKGCPETVVAAWDAAR